MSESDESRADAPSARPREALGGAELLDGDLLVGRGRGGHGWFLDVLRIFEMFTQKKGYFAASKMARSSRMASGRMVQMSCLPSL